MGMTIGTNIDPYYIDPSLDGVVDDAASAAPAVAPADPAAAKPAEKKEEEKKNFELPDRFFDSGGRKIAVKYKGALERSTTGAVKFKTGKLTFDISQPLLKPALASVFFKAGMDNDYLSTADTPDDTDTINDNLQVKFNPTVYAETGLKLAFWDVIKLNVTDPANGEVSPAADGTKPAPDQTWAASTGFRWFGQDGVDFDFPFLAVSAGITNGFVNTDERDAEGDAIIATKPSQYVFDAALNSYLDRRTQKYFLQMSGNHTRTLDIASATNPTPETQESTVSGTLHMKPFRDRAWIISAGATYVWSTDTNATVDSAYKEGYAMKSYNQDEISADTYTFTGDLKITRAAMTGLGIEQTHKEAIDSGGNYSIDINVEHKETVGLSEVWEDKNSDDHAVVSDLENIPDGAYAIRRSSNGATTVLKVTPSYTFLSGSFKPFQSEIFSAGLAVNGGLSYVIAGDPKGITGNNLPFGWNVGTALTITAATPKKK